MGNCLVTKLKASTGNPDLPIYGALTVKCRAYSARTSVLQIIGFAGNETFDVSLPDDSNIHFTDSTGAQDLGKSMVCTSDSVYYLTGPSSTLPPESDAVDLVILNKYAIKDIQLPGDYIVDGGEFEYMEIEAFSFNRCFVYNHDKFLYNRSLSGFSVNSAVFKPSELRMALPTFKNDASTVNLTTSGSSKFIGNVSSFMNTEDLAALYLRDSLVEGELGPVFTKWSQDGRTKNLDFLGNGIATIGGTVTTTSRRTVTFDGQGGYSVV